MSTSRVAAVSGGDIQRWLHLAEPEAQPDDEHATITMTLTTPGCPAGPTILKEVNDETEAMEHIRKVDIDLTFSPMWSEEMMSEDVRWILGR